MISINWIVLTYFRNCAEAPSVISSSWHKICCFEAKKCCFKIALFILTWKMTWFFLLYFFFFKKCKWWSDYVLRKIWLDFILLTFCKKYLWRPGWKIILSYFCIKRIIWSITLILKKNVEINSWVIKKV